MTNEKIVSTAIEQLEKENQEAEISKIKGIVKAYLERILNKKEEIKERQSELKELEADLNDLKAGRLDKIEERQTNDPNHSKMTLIYIKKIERDYLPYYPWRSPWIVEWNVPTGGVWNFAGNTISSSDLTLYSTGTAFQNFTGGSYTINGQTFNI
jgi:hypothetical protein